MSTFKKLLIVAAICFLGSLASFYISQIPPRADEFVPEGMPWTLWDYGSLILFLGCLGLTVAVKLRD